MPEPPDPESAFRQGKVIGLDGFSPNVRRATSERPLDIIDPCGWQDKPIPPREWLVEDLVPMHSVTMISGDGGLGKSLLAMQLLVACATGKEWLDQPTRRVKALGVHCEDDRDELHRRTADICEANDVGFYDLADLELVSRVGLENSLMDFPQYGSGEMTALFHKISNRALDTGAQLVVLDSLHDFYTGNENNRPQARQFVNALREIALQIEGAVVLLAHPSLQGMATGTGSSGSTAWNNTVRSRLYLTRPKANDEEEPDLNARILASKKANYSALGAEIAVRWRNGVFVRDIETTPAVQAIVTRNAERVFMELLARVMKQGRYVTATPRSDNYAPKIFSRMSREYRVKDFVVAMESLFQSGEIVVGEYKTGCRHRKECIVPNQEAK